MNNKNMFFRLVLFMAALCAALFFLHGSMNPKEEDAVVPQNTELEFYQQREEAINAFAAVLDGFSAEHPEGSIVQNRVANALEYLAARIQRSDMPDIFTHWPTQLSFDSASDTGKVLPLNDREFLDRIQDADLELCREEDGSIYALPVNRNCMEVYYNADLFREMGLSEPETLDELLAVCEAIKASGHTPLTFYPRDNRTAHIAQAMMAVLNGDYLTRLGELANGTISVEDRVALIDTLRLMRLMYLSYGDPQTGRTFYEACESFARGESAMIFTGSYALSLLRDMNPDFEMNVFAFPGRDADSHAVLTSIDTAVCISSDCADAGLALDFLEYLTRDEVIAEYVARDGAPSCIKGVYHDDPITRKMQQHISEYENAEWIKSRYSLESCLIFESAICSYLISGNENVLLREITTAFSTKTD